MKPKGIEALAENAQAINDNITRVAQAASIAVKPTVLRNRQRSTELVMPPDLQTLVDIRNTLREILQELKKLNDK